MHRGVLVQQHRDVGRRCFAGEAFHGREAHEHGGHFIFINQADFLVEFFVVAEAVIAAEKAVKQLRDVFNDQILFKVADAKILTAQALREAVHHHRDGEVIRHPAVAEHCFDIAGLHNKTGKRPEDMEPAGIIIQCVLDAAPFSALANAPVRVE